MLHAECSDALCQSLGWQNLPKQVSDDAGSSGLATSAAAQGISNYTSLNSTGDVDSNDGDATHFGLHVYGSGIPTGVVIDSGDDQVRAPTQSQSIPLYV